MKPEETLAEVVEALRSLGVEYMLTGSIAASYYGTPRATQDIDLIVDGTEEQLVRFAEDLSQKGFYVSAEAVRDAVEDRARFNVIDRRTAWKVDLILRKDREFSRTEFSRRTRRDALGMSLQIAAAEDVVLSKLEWAKLTGSERQIEDVVGILERDEGDLDRDYLARWVRRLAVDDQWRRAEERSKGGRG